MRATTDLLELDFVFSQRLPLTPALMIREYERRGLDLRFWEQLEALHRARVLIPVYRFAKNVKSVLHHVCQEAPRHGLPLSTAIMQALGDESVFRHHLRGIAEIGQPEDPRAEPYQSWGSYIRNVQDNTLWTSTFLYSPYQILLAPTLRHLLPKLKGRRTHRTGSSLGLTLRLCLDEKSRVQVETYSAANDELVIALTALETRYWPQVSGSVTNTRGDQVEPWSEYVQAFDPVAMLRWLSWEPEQISQTAQNLLHTADSLDPLGDWYELVRLCRFDKWERLRGDALVAMDFRMAAEMLLLFYEDLTKVGAAPPLPPDPKYFHGAHSTRLGTSREELEPVLMDFGLSPHPSLVCILEGDTEIRLVPQVFQLLGIPLRSDYIRLFNAWGVTQDLGVLAKPSQAVFCSHARPRSFWSSLTRSKDL